MVYKQNIDVNLSNTYVSIVITECILHLHIILNAKINAFCQNFHITNYIVIHLIC